MIGVVMRCRRRSRSMGTCSQYASWLGVHRSRRVARRCNITHACVLRHGPASDRNLFSRLHWPRGRSIPGSWMVGSLTNDLFGTSALSVHIRDMMRLLVNHPSFVHGCLLEQNCCAQNKQQVLKQWPSINFMSRIMVPSTRHMPKNSGSPWSGNVGCSILTGSGVRRIRSLTKYRGYSS